MLHPLEHVRDHQNPLTDAPALASRQAPQLGRPRFAAKEVCRHRPPQTWYAALLTLPHLEITGSRYKTRRGGLWVCAETAELPLHRFDASEVCYDDVFSAAL